MFRHLKLTIVWGVVLLLATVGGIGLSGQTQQVAAAFQIRPLLPSDNRVGEQQGYYDFSVVKHDSRTIGLKIYNPDAQDVQVNIRMLNGVTVDGKLQYAVHGDSGNELSNLLHGPVKITVPAKQEREYDFVLKHRHVWSGTKLGAISLTEATSNRSGVQNRVSYTVAILARGHQLSFKDMRHQSLVAVAGKNGSSGVQVKTHLRNRDGALLQFATMKLEMQNAFFKYLNYKTQRRTVKVAPHADYWLKFNLDGEKLADGEYRIRLSGKNDEYKQTLTKYVRVSKGVIRASNKRAYDDYLIRRVVFLVLALVLIVLAVVFIRRRMRQRKEV